MIKLSHNKQSTGDLGYHKLSDVWLIPKTQQIKSYTIKHV